MSKDGGREYEHGHSRKERHYESVNPPTLEALCQRARLFLRFRNTRHAKNPVIIGNHQSPSHQQKTPENSKETHFHLQTEFLSVC